MRLLSSNLRFLRAIAVIGGLAFGLVGCTSGPMNVEETYYLKVTNGTDNGYLRINVKAATQLSDAKYRSGWFLAEAVDVAFGNVAEDPTGATRAARDAMREKLIEALKKAQEAYLQVALNKDSTPEQIEQALQRWKRVRFAPGFESVGLSDTILVEYNPAQGIETVRAGEKLIFILSANPDQIIQSISKFANDAETKAAIQRFSNVIIENARADVEAKKARAGVASAADQFLSKKVTKSAQRLAAKPTRDEAVGELEGLRALVLSLQGTGGQP